MTSGRLGVGDMSALWDPVSPTVNEGGAVESPRWIFPSPKAAVAPSEIPSPDWGGGVGDNVVMKSFLQEEGRGLCREKTAKPTLRGGVG